MEYTKDQLDRIWSKGIAIDGYDSSIIRQDACGAWILRDSFGQVDSDYCWEVDHIYPKSLLIERGVEESFIDNEKNLRPLNRKNNISKSSDYPIYRGVTIADGEVNVECEKLFSVNSDVQAELDSFFGLLK